MSARRYAVGQLVFDRDRQAGGHIVGLYPSPLVARLADTAGFQSIARTVVCEPAAPPPAAPAADEARDGCGSRRGGCRWMCRPPNCASGTRS
ncbi:hypothetical protein VR46_42550 [Streptomyces sp. NRRL S-444]|nr:hypothetical protein VR46_42550 [Streptomyces sp. NRRL S-444]